MTTAKKNGRTKTRSTRKRTSPKVMAEAVEFIEQMARLEREHIPILPDHPPLH